MDNYGTCVKNQLDQAMIEASRLAKLALNICASLRQAAQFYLFIAENNSAQLTSEVPIQTIDKFRASMKSNQNKRENK